MRMSVKKLSKSRTMAALLSLSLLILMVPIGVFATADDIPGTPDNTPITINQVSEDTGTPSPIETTPSVPILGAVSPINQNNVQSVTVTGTADPTTTVVIVVSDEATGMVSASATSTANGSFNVMVDLSALKDGTVKVTAYATNDKGTKSDVGDAVSTLKDTAAPTGGISSPAPDSLVNTSTPKLVFNVSDGDVIVKVDGNPVKKTSGQNLDALADGQHSVEVYALDEVGNGSVAKSSFTVDTHPPVVSITAPVAGSTTNTTTPQLNFTVSDGTATVRVDDAVVSKKSGDKLDPLTKGTHTVSVEATDSVGNKGSAQSTFTVTTSIPAVVSTDPTGTANNVPVNKDIVITFSDDIQEGTTTAYSGVVLTSSTGTAVSITKGINGKTLTLHPTSSLAYSTSYTVTIPEGAVKNAAGNKLAGTYSFSFTTQSNPAIPPAPTGLKFLTNNGLIWLTWDVSKDKDVSGYNVYRKEKGTNNFTRLNSTRVSSEQYQDKTAKQGVEYIYHVVAIKVGLESPASNEVEGALAVVKAKTVTWPTDVSTKASNAKALKTFLTRGVFSTDADGKFHPDKAITRAEFAKAVYFIIGGKLINPAQPSFPDVAKSKWEYQYIERLRSLGIMIGYPNKTFRPNNSVTRAEVSKVAALVRKLPSASTGKLKDIGSSWAKAFINSCVKAGLFKGGTDNTFKPDGTVTRSQAVDILGWIDR